jgi:hypothetical protein
MAPEVRIESGISLTIKKAINLPKNICQKTNP